MLAAPRLVTWTLVLAAGAVAASWVAERAGFPIPFAMLSALCAASAYQ